MAKIAKGFAAHGSGEMVAETHGKSEEDQADIGAAGDVIGNEEDRASNGGEIFATDDFRVREEKRGWPGEGVVDEEAEPSDWCALRPAGIGVVGAFCGGLSEECLEIADCSGISELGFVEFDVVAMLEFAKEFYAIEGGEIL